MSGPKADLDARLRASAPKASLEERQALASIESRLFGHAPKTISLSRYVLLDSLGRGGVGMVYRAYDPELDRKVAIKLLLARRGTRDRETALLREAQAMARLSHPNVIAVYDVGTYDEHELGLESAADASGLEIHGRGVFVVMELVEGQDLHAWLAGGERSWREVVAAFLAAGRGLAAAHEAGLVHRDFKPSNVRVGSDGRVCVLDFGLAHPFAAPGGPPSDCDGSRSASEQLEIAGTPIYMSPEQHEGERADARSDQFSFGVALYEALCGRPPFTGSLDELRAAKRRDEPPPMRDELRMPARVWTIVKRTLAREPDERFASMTEVLGQLEAVLARPRRRRVALVGVTAVASAIGFSTLTPIPSPKDPCSGADARIAEVWNEASRARIEARLRATGASYVQTTWHEVRRELDDYTRAWTEQHKAACEATRVRHEQSEAVLDLRMACLDRHLAELDAVVDMLAHADVGVVEHAVGAVNALGWLGSCEDLDALRSRVKKPRDPELRRRVVWGYAELTRAKANDAAGRYDEALAIAQATAEVAQTLDYLPLLAAADLRRAAALEGQGDFAAAEHALLEAIWAAEASRDEPVATDAWIRLVWVVGVERNHHEQGEVWLRFAEAALERLGHDQLRAATLDHNRAGLYAATGRLEEAVDAYTRALEVQTRLLGPSDPTVARTLNHIANTLIKLQRYEEAFSYSTRSLEIRVATLGKDHPLIAPCYNNMAELRRQQGRVLEAEELVRAGLRVSGGTGTRFEYVSRVIAKELYLELGQLELAREQLERLTQIPEDRLPAFESRAGFEDELRLIDVPARQK
ncbi:Serine/threonine-protein kinase PknL [Enhygromyxa salina]|uniref:Serine/threonine-protein kinase PknL n=1 Tax=Enhygromyxa salina TaxID=215803 RepID=A0A2S9XFV7_9BACT|nr:serine/threonine-protein kinase [Enhygromyxa salina]PRP91749.1 Serine/threonine-protein kinase PknL [Enhygromyxa salina]